MTRLRQAIDADGKAVGRLICRAWAEYPGNVYDPLGEMAGVSRIASWVAGQGGRFWVFEDGGTVTGCAGVVPGEAPGRAELIKLYVDQHQRRGGAGSALLAAVETAAGEMGADTLFLWSDTRFTSGHAFYQARGFVRVGGTRALDDLSRSVEFMFERPIGVGQPA